MRKGNQMKAISRALNFLGLGAIASTKDRSGCAGLTVCGNIKNISFRENMIRISMLLSIVTLFAFVFAAPASAGDVAFVSASAKSGGDGVSWETAFDDLQDAIDLASNAKNGITQIWVTAGVYKPDRGSGDRDDSFAMLSGVGFYGGFAGGEKNLDERDPVANETILSADLQDNDVADADIIDPSVFDNSFHVLIAEDVDASARLDGFSIVGGTAHGSPFPRNVGGGIFIDTANPTIENCKFIENKGFYGGTVRILGEQLPSFTNCDFIRGYADGRGGGIYGRAIITGCSFTDNYSGLDAGAIYGAQFISNCSFVNNRSHAYGGAMVTDSAQIIDCTFSGNSAGDEDGNVYTEGGAISCSGSTEIINCIFNENVSQAGWGGAIRFGYGNLLVRDCSFVGNEAIFNASGGAIDSGQGTVIIDNCSFDGNSAARGGAIRTAPGIINNCIFRNNFADLRGGAVYTETPNFKIINCEFLGNNSNEDGGAIFIINDADLFLDNCLFAGNSALIDGGAIYNALGAPNLQAVNCSIYANFAGQYGGGLFIDYDGAADVNNSIFWSNTDVMNGANEDAQIFTGPNNATLSINYSLVDNLTGNMGGSGNIGDDPLFVDADGADNIPGTEDDDLHLMSGSPCIDAADNSAVLQCVLDLDSNSRFIDDPNTKDTGVGKPPIVDMGSYEYGSEPGLDCNYNGLWDDCEVLDQIALDCNGNIIPDECDIDAGFSEDCNFNGIPDECEIIEFDCNGNGIPDDCDIANGISFDCNVNGLPDSCDIDDGFSNDCDMNGIPDECQGLFSDCNANGIADECEIAQGLVEDCNKNGIPDECDLTGSFQVDSGLLSPLGSGFPHSISLSSLPEAMSNVTLSFIAISDLSSASEWVMVLINDFEVGIVFNSGANDCPLIPDEDQLILTATEFNELITDGEAIVDLIASSSVNSLNCGDQTFIRMTLQYSGFESHGDLNKNGIPDECDIPGDLNGDGFVTTSDLLILFSVWGPCMDCGACLGDIDGNCDVSVSDLLILFANWS